MKNPDVLGTDWPHIVRMFRNRVNETYIPLTTLSYAIERRFLGHEAYIIHRDNLMLHLGVVALIFSLALRIGLGVYAAGLAALLFGIHPMHVESVAWVTQRKDVLYSLFYLLALNSYLKFIDTASPRAYGLSVLYGLLSILAKPMALSLPLVLFLFDWFKKRSFNKTRVLEKLPHVLLIVPITAVTYIAHARVIHNEPFQAFLIWVWSLTFYVEKFFFPVTLSPLYALPGPVAVTEPSYILALFEAAVIIALVVRLRRNRWFIFAGLYYFLSIFFLLRYDDVKDVSIVADRFMYLPSLGLCLFLGFVAQTGSRTPFFQQRFFKFFGTACLLFVLTWCGHRTYLQSRIWKDSLTLWTAAIERDPFALRAYYNRAREYEETGQFDLAVADYTTIIHLKSDEADAYNNRAAIYVLKDQYGLALQDFIQATHPK